MRIGAIIQARMSSTRLPGKIALELPYGGGITVLEQIIRRLQRCRFVDVVVVATTLDRADAAVVRIAEKAGAMTSRGSREDVLSRYWCAAKKHALDTIVRVTSDCPCMDPLLIDKLIVRHIRTGADYTANIIKLTYPDGFDAEVFSFEALTTAYQQAKEKSEREHVTLYMRGHQELFKLASVEAPAPLRRPELRVTLDTMEDYALLCAIYDQLYTRKHFFGFKDVLRLFRRNPWLENINRRSVSKHIFDSESEELRQALKLLKLQELGRAARILERYCAKRKSYA